MACVATCMPQQARFASSSILRSVRPSCSSQLVSLPSYPQGSTPAYPRELAASSVAFRFRLHSSLTE
jgi:hypothetical protein